MSKEIPTFPTDAHKRHKKSKESLCTIYQKYPSTAEKYRFPLQSFSSDKIWVVLGEKKDGAAPAVDLQPTWSKHGCKHTNVLPCCCCCLWSYVLMLKEKKLRTVMAIIPTGKNKLNWAKHLSLLFRGVTGAPAGQLVRAGSTAETCRSAW